MNYTATFIKNIQKAIQPTQGIKIEQQRRPPKIYFDEKNHIKTIIVSQTLLKAHSFKGEKNDLCWKRFYHEDLIHSHQKKITLPMLYGLYFEQQCIGRSRYDDKTELPRKQNGQKTIDHIRIDEQVFLFKSKINEYGILLDPIDGGYRNVQVQARRKLKLAGFEGIDIFLEGVADIVTPLEYENYNWPMAICDIKLTKDRFGGWGRNSWEYPDNRDHIQAIVYSKLFNLPFFYWVFDYKSTDRGEVIYPVNTNVEHSDFRKANEAKLRIIEMNERIRSYCADIITNNNIWPVNPRYEICKMCSVLECKSRNTIKEI
jgi:hypothetical protein